MKIYEALIPSQYFSKLFGATPFSVSRTNVRYSRFGVILPFVHITILLALLLLCWDKLPFNLRDVQSALETGNFWMQSILAAISVAKDGFWQREMIDIVQSIKVYDLKTGYDRDISIKCENKYIFIWGIAFSILVVTFACLRLVFILYNTPRKLVYLIQDEITLLYVDFSVYMFSTLASIIGMRFRYLNSILEKQQRNEGRVSRSSLKSNPEYTRELYTSLVAIGRKLNDHYSSRLFLWTARIMLEVILRIFVVTKNSVNSFGTLLLVIRLGPLAVWLFLYTVSCQFVIDQVNKIPCLLFAKNILHFSRTEKERKEILTMGVYMVLRPFTFSALGFFTVDVSLACGVFAVIITYTALCIQTRLG